MRGLRERVNEMRRNDDNRSDKRGTRGSEKWGASGRYGKCRMEKRGKMSEGEAEELRKNEGRLSRGYKK